MCTSVSCATHSSPACCVGWVGSIPLFLGRARDKNCGTRNVSVRLKENSTATLVPGFIAGTSFVRAEKAGGNSFGWKWGQGSGTDDSSPEVWPCGLTRARVPLAAACTCLILFPPCSTRPPASPPTLACKVILDATDEEAGAKDGKN
ncbi:unnamed protein product [Ectocarpus sp. 12 AP-2014]